MRLAKVWWQNDVVLGWQTESTIRQCHTQFHPSFVNGIAVPCMITLVHCVYWYQQRCWRMGRSGFCWSAVLMSVWDMHISEYLLQILRKLHFPSPAFSANRASPLANSLRVSTKQRKPQHIRIHKQTWILNYRPFNFYGAEVPNPRHQ